MAADKLIPVRFKKGDEKRAGVQAFRCGSQPHETPLADWIKNGSVKALSDRKKIWLYECEDENGQRQLVGYGSLCKCKIETTGEDNSTRTEKVLEIPMLAVHEDFQGRPKDVADKEAKFSRQIVRHLQQMALEDLRNGQGMEPALTLYVHPAG